MSFAQLNHDRLCRLSHGPFLRVAKQRAHRGAKRLAVQHALQFIRLVPQAAAHPHACTLAISVCTAAQDLPAALEVAECFRAGQGTMDELLYASLINGKPRDGGLHARAFSCCIWSQACGPMRIRKDGQVYNHTSTA